LGRNVEKGSIIRYNGVAFEGEQGRKYAAVVKKIVDCCHAGLEDVGEEGVSDLLSQSRPSLRYFDM
jgi:dynein light chain roadblock-type